MTIPAPHSAAPTAADPLDHEALWLAAEAVLAHLCGRAPTRVLLVSLESSRAVQYALEPDPAALRGHRGLLEDVVLAALGRDAAAELLGTQAYRAAAERDPRRVLLSGLDDPEEQAVADDYLRVLSARARATLRRHWAEVQVVAAGLREHGSLDAPSIAHRIACAQGIRAALLN